MPTKTTGTKQNSRFHSCSIIAQDLKGAKCIALIHDLPGVLESPVVLYSHKIPIHHSVFVAKERSWFMYKDTRQAYHVVLWHMVSCI